MIKLSIHTLLILLISAVNGQCLTSNPVNITTPPPLGLGFQLIKSANPINVSNLIENGNRIYRSGNSLTFKEGFHAKTTNFHAYIAPCTNINIICPIPSNLIATPTSDTTADINWLFTKPNDIAHWKVEIKENTELNYVSSIYKGSLPYKLNSLKPGTTYNFKVSSVCDNSTISLTSTILYFTTPSFTHTNLIWQDNGVTRRNWWHNNEYDIESYANICPTSQPAPSNCAINSTLDIIPGRTLTYETVNCFGGGSWSISDETTPMLMFDTVNYKNEQLITGSTNNTSGFKFDAISPSVVGKPIEFNIYNQMLNSNDSCDIKNLHEVGLIFQHWACKNTPPDTPGYPDPIEGSSWEGKWAFKKSYSLGEFNNNIKLSFDAKINKSQTEVVTIKAFLTADLRYGYYTSAGGEITSGLIGVIFYENNFEENLDSLYWSSDGIENGVSVNPIYKKLIRDKYTNVAQPDGTYKKIVINFSDFIKFLPPPLGKTYSDAIIRGLDIYSHVRGKSDLNFSIKNIRIEGRNPTIIAPRSSYDSSQKEEIIKIFPNPNDGNFIINTSNITKGKVVISDLYGLNLYEKEFNQNEIEVNLKNNSTGILVIKIITEDKTYTSKFIKK